MRYLNLDYDSQIQKILWNIEFLKGSGDFLCAGKLLTVLTRLKL